PLISGRLSPASHTLKLRTRSLCCRLRSLRLRFRPSYLQTSGALNKEGETQIIRFPTKREGITHTVYAARAWARLSCCVQAASAQQILNRDVVDWSEVADGFD